jgi:hypothetical protein
VGFPQLGQRSCRGEGDENDEDDDPDGCGSDRACVYLDSLLLSLVVILLN